MLLSVQVDAQTKSKRDIRYSNEFKKFALSLHFLSPRTYKEFKKSFTLPSVRTLQSFTYNWNINWKVPLCYCFAGTTCTSGTLKNIIFDAIIKLRESGATVHTLVTDMGSNFPQMSRELEFCDKFASWSYIVQFYSKDIQQWIKAASKLSPIHIEPNNFSKMKVKYAVQVLSNHVAARMCTLMGSIRQQGGNCVNPTPIQFTRAFKKLFSIKLLQSSDTKNCAPDSDEILNLMETSNLRFITSDFNESFTQKILDVPTHDYRSMDLPEQNAFKYVCGYLIKRCLSIHSCEACTDYMNKDIRILDETTLYCSFRDYGSENGELFGALTIPSNNLCLYIHKLDEIFVKNFETNCYNKNIGIYLLSLVQDINFQSPCPDFPIDFFRKLFLRMRIYFALLQHNKACKGVDQSNRKRWNILHL
ncbi:hypothetical protein ALC57_00268 [Trachymyrmex cornetzi]|uniref:THAP domain-containing protein 9 n=1 Tax=Trachymyrmex cornetzi TaxID=471704 RepID=A0A151JSS6_9HYME|nr:hypothetical protein ALC57_00268 [Trachymyrmex cornetzi]